MDQAIAVVALNIRHLEEALTMAPPAERQALFIKLSEQREHLARLTDPDGQISDEPSRRSTPASASD
jgi:hypothetical protein